MRSPLLALATASVLCSVIGTSRLSASSEVSTKIVAAHATIASRTALTVSSEVLQFAVTGDGQPAIATVDFVASIRTHAGAEVVLTVEGVSAQPTVVGRWVGSGQRTGRISFALRGAGAGTYTLPVRFVLTAP
jgi:hypothetical protein